MLPDIGDHRVSGRVTLKGSSCVEGCFSADCRKASKHKAHNLGRRFEEHWPKG